MGNFKSQVFLPVSLEVAGHGSPLTTGKLEKEEADLEALQKAERN